MAQRCPGEVFLRQRSREGVLMTPFPVDPEVQKNRESLEHSPETCDRCRTKAYCRRACWARAAASLFAAEDRILGLQDHCWAQSEELARLQKLCQDQQQQIGAMSEQMAAMSAQASAMSRDFEIRGELVRRLCTNFPKATVCSTCPVLRHELVAAREALSCAEHQHSLLREDFEASKASAEKERSKMHAMASRLRQERNQTLSKVDALSAEVESTRQERMAARASEMEARAAEDKARAAEMEARAVKERAERAVNAQNVTLKRANEIIQQLQGRRGTMSAKKRQAEGSAPGARVKVTKFEPL